MQHNGHLCEVCLNLIGRSAQAAVGFPKSSRRRERLAGRDGFVESWLRCQVPQAEYLLAQTELREHPERKSPQAAAPGSESTRLRR